MAHGEALALERLPLFEIVVACIAWWLQVPEEAPHQTQAHAHRALPAANSALALFSVGEVVQISNDIAPCLLEYVFVASASQLATDCILSVRLSCRAAPLAIKQRRERVLTLQNTTYKKEGEYPAAMFVATVLIVTTVIAVMMQTMLEMTPCER